MQLAPELCFSRSPLGSKSHEKFQCRYERAFRPVFEDFFRSQFLKTRLMESQRNAQTETRSWVAVCIIIVPRATVFF
jgi:hypothetical protein